MNRHEKPPSPREAKRYKNMLQHNARVRYDNKIKDMARGQAQDFTPPEAIQFLLDFDHFKTTDQRFFGDDNQYEKEILFNRKLGHHDDYFRDNVFNSAHNNCANRLPKRLIALMAALTNEDEEFWGQTKFSSERLADVWIHMDCNIQAVIDAHHHTEARARA